MENKRDNEFKLIYKFGEYHFNLPKQYKIVHWVPIIFPPCRNIYLFSKDPDNTFNVHFREQLIKHLDYKATSVYDTCGYNPLLYIIEDRNLALISKKLNILKDKGIDLTPNVFSYCMPDSVIKRHGYLFGKASENKSYRFKEKQSFLNSHPYLVDVLEYIIYFRAEDFIGDEFQDNFDKASLKKSKNELEESIKLIINDLRKSNNNKLVSELTSFHKKDRCYFENSIDEIKKFINSDDNIYEYLYFNPIIITPILAFVFLRLSSVVDERKNKQNFIIDNLSKDRNIIDLYRLNCNKDDYVIKVWAENIDDLDKFINNNFYKNNIYTSTKIVLKPWKKEGWIASKISQYYESKKEALTTLDHQILSVIDNHAERLCSLNEDDQVTSIISYLRINRVENAKKYLIKSHLGKLKTLKVIEKFSIKLEKKQWIKTLIFIKAASGEKERLSSIIKQELLGISEISFARKFYHLTGEYDFIVPIDFLGLAFLRSEVGSFSEKAGELISNIRIFTEISKDFIGVPVDNLELDEPQQALINSLLPNSENYNYAAFDNSPRSIFYNNYCKKLNSLIPCDSINFNSIKSFILPTVEIKSSSMIHMFVRFRIKNKKEFDNVLKGYESSNTQIKLGITLRIFRPLHDTNICFCIITVKSFELLNSFLREFDDYSSSILPNLIFNQSFFESKVPFELMCRPCISHQTLKCRACKQYITPRSKSNIHTFDLGINEFGKIKITLNQIREIKDKEYKRISEKIINQIKEGYQFIVFPELTIPTNTIKKILNTLANEITNINISNNIYIIPGSQIAKSKKLKHEKVNLILIDDKKQIHEYSENYRNFKSEHDDELDYGNNGVWRYVNTGCGNFAIINCIDFIAEKGAIINQFKDENNRVDIIFVIAKNYNPTGIKHYNILADSFASETNVFIGIVNNAGPKFGGTSLWGPIVNQENSSLIHMISSEDDGEINYEIDLVELDKSRSLNTEYLSIDEGKIIKNKYYWKIASSPAYGPIHTEKWTEKVEQDA